MISYFLAVTRAFLTLQYGNILELQKPLFEYLVNLICYSNISFTTITHLSYMTNTVRQPEKRRFLSEAKALLLLSVPIVISQLAQMGMNFTDTVMAGRHSETSLAGVAIGSSFWVPCFLFLVGVLMAITPMVAQAWGARNTKDIKYTIQQGLWLAIVLGLSMMFVLQLLGNVFDGMEMEAQTRAQAKGYVFAVSFGLPALAFFQILR